MKIEIVVIGNQFLIIQNDKIIAELDWHFADTLNPEIEKAIVNALRPNRRVTGCCANEKRNMNGGCDNCGDPCY